jgi:hypothetical protein
LDRRFYELCALAELKNALRSGDIWVQGSRQFKDFDEYLIPNERFSALREANRLSLAVATDCEAYLKDRLCRLEQQLETVDRIAQSGELPDVIITVSGLKITPLASAVPEEADQLIRQDALLPRVKITELLLDVDDWTGFTRHFTHLKSREVSRDRILLLTAILADAINLGLTKIAEACPGATYARLTWLQAWHIRDETYSAALAEVVNAQFRHPFAAFWDDGTTSSSDGQYFRAGGRGEAAGQINAHYRGDPGVLCKTPNSVGAVQIGLNKGEAKNALARAVFFNRLGEMRDRSFENQRYRASGLTLVVAAIILWNTVYLSRAIDDLKARGLPVDDNLLEHLSAGNTSISRAITFGVRTGVWKAANLDLSDRRFLFLAYDFFRFVR